MPQPPASKRTCTSQPCGFKKTRSSAILAGLKLQVDFTSIPATVLRAGRGQRGRDGSREPPVSAHVGELLYVWLAIPRFRQARVVAYFLVDSLAVEPGQPCLDPPRGDEHEDVFIGSPGGGSLLRARGIELGEASGDPRGVPVQHDDERHGHTVSLAAMFRELLGKLLPNELLGGASPLRCLLDPEPALRLARQPSRRLEESFHEGLVLPVFAQQDDLHFPVHVSHPLAISSERLSPGEAGVASGWRTVTTPDFSRWSV